MSAVSRDPDRGPALVQTGDMDAREQWAWGSGLSPHDEAGFGLQAGQLSDCRAGVLKFQS